MAEYEDIRDRTVELARRPFVMPIEEIQLSAAFACLPDIEHVVERLIAELFSHENFHVRRVAINATRRAKVFGVSGLETALTMQLGDSEAWVRYDAVWAVEDAGYDSPEIRRVLAGVAAGWTPGDGDTIRANPGDAHAQARVRARKALDVLSAKPY